MFFWGILRNTMAFMLVMDGFSSTPTTEPPPFLVGVEASWITTGGIRPFD